MTPSSTPATEEGVLQKSIRAGKWLGIDFVCQRGLGFVGFLILARLLAPEDFGLVTVILLVPLFLQSTSETGLVTAMIQSGEDMMPYLNPIWTLNLVRATGIALVMFFFGSWIADFYQVESVTWLIRLSGVFVLIYQLGNIGEVFFTKHLDFKKIFLRNLFRTIAYTGVSAVFAVVLHNYWALLIGNLAMSVTQTVSTYILHPYRPRLSFAFGTLKRFTGYSKWIFGQIAVDRMYGFLENSIVARMTNTHELGIYTKAKNIGSIGPASIASIITLVSLPAYAKIKESKEKIREGLKKSLDLLFAVIMPIIVVVIAAGGKLILLLLGEPWLPMTNALRLFVVYFTLTSLVEISNKLFSGIGHPDKKVKMDLLKSLLTVILLIVLIPLYGVSGAALAMVLAFLPIFVINTYYLVTLVSISYWSILVRMLAPLALSSVILLPFLFFKDQVLAWSTPLLFAAFLAGAFLYMLGIYAVGKIWGRGPYMTISLILKTLPKV